MSRSNYDEIFRSVDEDEKRLVGGVIEDCVWLEEQLRKLRKLDHIQINPRNKSQMRLTPAARLYKQYATTYANNIRVLLNVLRKVETTAQDDLLRKLEEFSLE